MPLSQHRTRQDFPIFVGLLFVVWTLRATVLFYVDQQLPEGTARQLYSLISKALLWLAPAVLYAVAIRGDRPAMSLRLGWPDFSRQAWLTLVVAGTALLLVAWDAMRQHQTTLSGLGHAWLEHGMGVALWALPTVAIEEMVFRGLILTELTERFRSGAANVIAALLFVAVHWPHWLWMHGFTTTLARDSAGVFFVGLVTGFLAHRTRSIWPGVVWHTANNCLAGVW